MPVRHELSEGRIPLREGLVVALALGLAGCNVLPTKAYEGPSRPEQELSLLKAGASGEELSPISRVDLRVIDGAPQRSATYFASVLPGRHTIGLSHVLRIGTRDRVQFCAFEIETAAGCTYMPSPPSVPTDAQQGPWEWNVDMLVVAECPPGGGFQVRVPARCGSSSKVLEKVSK